MKDKDHQKSRTELMLNKVPEITIFFWIIKVLCTTVGETGADFLNTGLNLGLDGVTLIMGALLAVTLFFQFKAKKYVPGVYWLAVVLISIVGTLITDNLTDRIGVPLTISTIAFGISLSIVFAVWYKKERTLSIHTIVTTRREAFYWLAILVTFALGTAAGDLLAEKIDIGYLLSLGVFAAMIGAVAISHFVFKVNAVLAFWLAYILTRPLGASIGDYLSQDVTNGGLGLGPEITSMIFFGIILATVIYLAVTKVDVIRKSNFGDQV
ncbi:MAG: COG4705 family protein [Nitrosotalea sp.]